MTLQLPPERTLDDPDRMVESILSAPVRGRRPSAPRTWALVAAGTAVVVGSAIGLHGRASAPTSVLGTPAVTVSASQPVQPAPQQVTPSRTPEVVVEGATVRLAHVDVTLTRAGQLRVDGRLSDEYTIDVVTCVRSLPPGTGRRLVPLRADSWSLSTTTGRVNTSVAIRRPVPLTTTYPEEDSARVGGCVRGVIPFQLDSGSRVITVDYRSTSGDRVSWTPKR